MIGKYPQGPYEDSDEEEYAKADTDVRLTRGGCRLVACKNRCDTAENEPTFANILTNPWQTLAELAILARDLADAQADAKPPAVPVRSPDPCRLPLKVRSAIA